MDFTYVRHQLHQMAEISGQEINTHNFIKSLLQPLHPTQLYEHVGGNGLLAVFEFSPENSTVLIRADMDAVGIQEDTKLDYQSKNQNIAHVCGHDGHTAILLKLAYMLVENPPKQRVLLLFQPSEENGKGGEAVLKSGVLNSYHIDWAFALHNIPGYPVGTVLCRDSFFTCAVLSSEIRFQGRTSHAAEPEKGVSPLKVMMKIIEAIMLKQQTNYSETDYFLTTLIEVHIGEEAYGVSAGDGLIRWTYRAKTNAILQQKIKDIESIVKQYTQTTEGLFSSITYSEAFYANENQLEAVQFIREAARQNHYNYQELEEGFRWGEDFGCMTQNIRGAMFGLGSGVHHEPLHSSKYDFPDELIDKGAQMFYQLIHSIH